MRKEKKRSRLKNVDAQLEEILLDPESIIRIRNVLFIKYYETDWYNSQVTKFVQ